MEGLSVYFLEPQNGYAYYAENNAWCFSVIRKNKWALESTSAAYGPEYSQHSTLYMFHMGNWVLFKMLSENSLT